jgi:endonuclease G
MTFNIRIFIFLVLSATLNLSCSTSNPVLVYRKAVSTEYGKQAGFSPAEQAFITKNCPLGMPRIKPGVDLGPTKIIAREGYVLEHSASDKIPLWVCEGVTSAQVSGHLTRPKPEPFAPDPKLTNQRRAELKDYKGSGYDRGHQAPSADETVNSKLQAETYFLANMCPQTAELNQRIWKALEEAVREMTKTNDPIFITTGPMFFEEAEENAATADGLVEHKVIGAGVAVPTHFYKIVEWKDRNGEWQGTAIVMKNQKTAFPKPYHFNQYVRPIKWVEDRAGLNFAPDLPGPAVGRVELKSNPIWN